MSVLALVSEKYRHDFVLFQLFGIVNSHLLFDQITNGNISVVDYRCNWNRNRADIPAKHLNVLLFRTEKISHLRNRECQCRANGKYIKAQLCFVVS